MANQKKPKKAQPKRLGSRPQARTAKALKRKAKPAPHVPYAARPAKAPVEEARPDEIFKTRIPSEFAQAFAVNAFHHRAPPLLAVRTAGQPAAIHSSISSARHRTSPPR
jgi:hypothetical protein